MLVSQIAPRRLFEGSITSPILPNNRFSPATQAADVDAYDDLDFSNTIGRSANEQSPLTAVRAELFNWSNFGSMVPDRSGDPLLPRRKQASPCVC